MGMTFEEGLNNLIELQKDYQQFHDDVWQDPESYGIMAESLRIGIETMRKYQKIEQIYRMWNEVNDFPLAMWNIGGVLGDDD